MLNLYQFMNIRFLQKQGHSVRKIARLSGHSRHTLRKLLRAKRAPTPVPRVRLNKLDAYKPYLTERWQAHGLYAVRLQPEIVAQGFTGSVKIYRGFLHTLKVTRHTDQSLTVRFETPPVDKTGPMRLGPRLSAVIRSRTARAPESTRLSWYRATPGTSTSSSHAR